MTGPSSSGPAAAGPADRELLEYTLRLGDNSLILAQRLCEWIGHAPELEEDIGLANLTLDLLGQSRLLLGLAGEIEGRGRSEDDLAFLREDSEFRNVLIVEQPNRDFGHTMLRQLFFSAWQLQLFERLSASNHPRLAEIAAKALKETRYHLRYASTWVVRLGDGTPQSHERAQNAAEELWRFTGELFESDGVEQKLAASGIAPLSQDLRAPWRESIVAVFTEATLTLPAQQWMASGGRSGRHSEHLGYLLAEMQHLQRTHPGAEW